MKLAYVRVITLCRQCLKVKGHADLDVPLRKIVAVDQHLADLTASAYSRDSGSWFCSRNSR